MDMGCATKIDGRTGFWLRSLYANDIFNTVRERELTIYGDTRIDFYQKRPTQSFGVARKL